MRSGLTYISFFLVMLLNSCIQVYGQDINAIIESLQIDTALNSGPKDNRINFAIQNRGVDNPSNDFKDKDEFYSLFYADLYQAFDPESEKAQAPYAQYRNFFNLYAVYWPDALSDSEGWNFSIIKSIRDSLFLPWANNETGWATFFSTTRHGGGGGAGLDREKRVGDGKMYGMGWETLLHEFGHTMPGLLDEYSASGEWSGGNCWETGNSTGFLTLDDIPWRKWIDPGTPLPTPYTEAYLNTIGAFEGAMTNYFGCHRPTARSCYMGAGGFGEDYGQELCPICVQRVICYLYKYVNPIEAFSPSVNELYVDENETINFSVQALAPSPNTQKYSWFVNGKLMAVNTLEFEYNFTSCTNYEVTFRLEDTTEWVRHDEKFENIYPKPVKELIWSIQSNTITEYSLGVVLETTPANCTGSPNGFADFEISGGALPYEIYLDNNLLENPVVGLEEGQYNFYIVDGNQCKIEAPAIIEKENKLSAQICAEQINGLWNIAVNPEGYTVDEVDFEWSSGETENLVSGLPSGDYSITLTTASGCQLDTSIHLLDFNTPLMVVHTAIDATEGQENGKIFVKANGGIPEYTIEWAEKADADQTSDDDQFINASGSTWGHLPVYAFDNDLNTKWLHFVSSDAWISYYFPESAVIKAYSITSGDDVPERDPKDWSFQASIDGENWIDLDNQADQNFEKRKQRRLYSFKNDKSFNYFRFYVHENHGDGSIQLQQLEFIGINSKQSFKENTQARNKFTRHDLPAGSYIYNVSDQNNICVSDTVIIENEKNFVPGNLEIIPYNECSVTIKEPDLLLNYFWFSDPDLDDLIFTGQIFTPQKSQNYYLAVQNISLGNMFIPAKGFAVQLPETPDIFIGIDSSLQITDPDPEMIYTWYDADHCNAIVHTGVSYFPEESGSYYASAAFNQVYPDAIDPKSIGGLILRMDAADLDGDGKIDDPAFPTSSILDWNFENGNYWADNNWFAYRSNYQNGLGVADFATIWLQRIQNAENFYQTVIMAYEENPISFEKTAPFEGLSYHLPASGKSDQILHDDAPLSTKNGSHFLNGKEIDPFNEQNTFEFRILASILTEPSTKEFLYTDTKWEGKIGEIILYDHALSTEEILGVSEFLRKKWMSTAELSSPRKEIFYPYGISAVQPTSENFVRIYPNPSNSIVHLESSHGIMDFTLINMQGQPLITKQLEPGNNLLSVDHLEPGIYYFIFADRSGKFQTERFVKI